MTAIDLNCDMGESFGHWIMGQDALLMEHITSANVACGAHAGDPNVMAATVALAKKHAVAVGAHPGFPDLQGFGRRPVKLSSDEIANSLLYQLGALWAFLKAEGMELHHVKPHGALYNMASADEGMAETVVKSIRRFSRDMPIYCLPQSALERQAKECGVLPVAEGFADRAYEPNGSLVDRSAQGSLYTEPGRAASQAVQLARGSVTCMDSSTLHYSVRTICVHGDTPGAPQIAAAVRGALTSAGITVTADLDE